MVLGVELSPSDPRLFAALLPPEEAKADALESICQCVAPPKPDTQRTQPAAQPQLSVHFVDDRLDTLVAIARRSQLSHVRLYLADWGYNTQEERRAAAENPRISVISLQHFRRPASSTPDAGPGLASNSHAGHAFLHDFCMTIPYGVVALLASVVALFLGTAMKPLALPLAGAGVVALACSSFSLKTWKQGQSTAPFTMLSAGGAGAAAYASWTVLQTQVGFGLWFSGALAGLSVLAALFCVYNVLAGGNPPRQGKH
ncbi:hypothetical protein QJQ45_006111 [Haematococcus lacustris]|nr:hypothetical protein QJQ45_006111 [Haematococcus lacustris]